MADYGLVSFISNHAANNNIPNRNSVARLFGCIIQLLFAKGFLKNRILTELLFLLNRKKIKGCTNTVNLFENVNVCSIELPFRYERYNQINKESFLKLIRNLCKANNLQCCLCPGLLYKTTETDMYEIYEIESDTYISEIGRIVLKAVLVDILTSIYSKSGIRLDKVEIAVISGENEQELISIIRLLEPEIKHVTVLAHEKNKKLYEQLLSEQFEDTGLSVNVSNDYKKALGNCRLVINLADAQEIIPYRLHRKSLFINLNKNSIKRLSGENLYFNGIAFEFTDKNFKDFVFKYNSFYSKRELSNLTLTHRLDIFDSVYDDGTLEKIRLEFKKGACKITGVEGHRGIISLENAIKSIA